VRYHNIINILKAYKNLIDEIKFSISLVLVMQILDKKYFNDADKPASLSLFKLTNK
jgi:hypothetical protein